MQYIASQLLMCLLRLRDLLFCCVSCSVISVLIFPVLNGMTLRCVVSFSFLLGYSFLIFHGWFVDLLIAYCGLFLLLRVFSV